VAKQPRYLQDPFRKDLLDTPVFRPFSELDCETSTGRARGADAFGKEFAALGYRSGYEMNVTARACRRWALMETDTKIRYPVLLSEPLTFHG
jgi:carbonic anhydrase